MTFRKYIENLPRPLTDTEKEDLKSIEEPFILGEDSKRVCCFYCSRRTSSRIFSVYLPTTEEEIPVVFSHDDGVTDYCRKIFERIGLVYPDAINMTHQNRLMYVAKILRREKNKDKIYRSQMVSYDI